MAVAVVVAPLVALFLARTRLGKQMRAVADNRSGIRLRHRRRAHRRLRLDLGRRPGRIGRGDARSEPGRLRSQYGVGAALPDLHCGGQRGRAYGALVAGLALGLAMELSTWDVLFGGPTQIQTGAGLRRPDLAPALPAARAFRPGAGALMEIFNLPFWVFVAVIAGIYTIFAPGSISSSRWPDYPTSATLPSRRWPPTRWPS